MALVARAPSPPPQPSLVPYAVEGAITIVRSSEINPIMVLEELEGKRLAIGQCNRALVIFIYVENK